MQKKNLRKRAVVALLHNVRNRRALSRNACIAEVWGGVASLQEPGFVEGLVEELGGGSGQLRRRFEILRRSDIQRESHQAIARDVGLSRSQFYRDLNDAREHFAQALEDHLDVPAVPVNDDIIIGDDDARFVAIHALRDGGRFALACELAGTVARDSHDAVQRIRALCVRAELQSESGLFARARTTTAEARSLAGQVVDERMKDFLGANCDLIEFESSHCQGSLPTDGARNAFVDGLRRRSRDRGFAVLLVKALIGEASILFQSDQGTRALEAIEEASSIVARDGLGNTRMAVDLGIRASGVRALQADQVSSALEDTSKIVDTGKRKGDVRTMRLGMQMMAAHLLTLGRLEEARAFALEAWALIDLFGSALDRLIMLSNLARIEIHSGNGEDALRWIALANELHYDAFSITQALAISQAEALQLVGQAGRAATLSRSLSERVREWPRLFGRAKLAEATALSSLKQEREARARSEEAVELSRGTAGPLLHLRALDLNVKLTGNAGSKAALRELRAALRAGVVRHRNVESVQRD